MSKRPAVKKGKKKNIIQEEHSENMDNDEDMALMEQANMGIDQEQLTQEQKDETIHKSLTSKNP